MALHTRAGHARGIAHGLGKGAPGGLIVEIVALAVRTGARQNHAVPVEDIPPLGGGAVETGVIDIGGPGIALGIYGHAVPHACADEEHQQQHAYHAHIAPQFLHRPTSPSSILEISRASSSEFMEEMPSRIPMEKKLLTREEPP